MLRRKFTPSRDTRYIDATADYALEDRARQSHDLGRLIGRYLNELEAEGIENPLSQPFTLAAVLNDLCTLAEIQPPAAIVLAVGA